MTKKQKLEEARYKNSAMVHTKKRLAQRYPKIYRSITHSDLKNAPYIRLFPTRESSRIVTAIMINDNIIYIVKSLSKNMIHTVLTESQVQELIDNGNLDISLERKSLEEAILSQYKTYTRYIDAKSREEI